MLNYIEQDICEPDKCLYDLLLLRLGKSPNRLELILSEDEYKSMRERDIIEELCWKREGEKAYEVLERYMKRVTKESKVQKMYEYRVKAYISGRINQDVISAERYLRQAVEMTLPGFGIDNMNKYLISVPEMENILAVGKCLMELGKIETARQLFDKCRKYILLEMSFSEQVALVYCKCVWLLARVSLNTEKQEQVYFCCKEALNGLQRFGILYFMIPLLEQLRLYSAVLEKADDNRKWEVYLESLIFVYREYGKEWYCLDSLFHRFNLSAYHLDSEFILQERNAQNMTQESLIEGVYQSPESLSRVENGWVCPSKNKMDGLMKKLGFSRGRVSGMVAVERLAHYEMKEELDFLIENGQYLEAKDKLQKFEKVVENKWKINQIIIENYRNAISECIQGGNDMDMSSKCYDVLRNTYWFYDEKYNRIPLEGELKLLNQYALDLNNNNRRADALEIFRQVLICIEQSKMCPRYRSKIMSLPFVNMAILLNDKKMLERGICFEVECGKGTQLSYYLDTLSALVGENAICFCEKAQNQAHILAEIFPYKSKEIMQVFG